ncbi:FAD-binding oxidoreductase [Sphingomonas sp.]|uniref:FAD-binding oxidoreductase n=1 Tax=Sphingomonas sp. TaxID=28214 RepID=UPI001B1F3726|nr:FAD-binding oxidoreductase [Sphingomonas sp.]MBO9711522.1 FAD-binding oxidoreductase [Sphingomonas sp.]
MIRDGKRGRNFRRGEPGYEAALFGTSFNRRDTGRRPARIVQANSAEEVQAAVLAARQEGLKVSLCSGGHSWSQNHIRDDVLMLDLSRLNAIEIDREAMSVRIGAGVEGAALNRALARRGLFVPTPHAPDVGMGGFLLQGGFGWGSRAFGLGCEQVTAIEAVLADGRMVRADAETHAELYWAARGAGPGFFAAVTAYHLRLHKRPRAIGIQLQFFAMDQLDTVFRWVDEMGPSVSRKVELQVLMSPYMRIGGGPTIEVIAPVLADSWAEARAATAFVRESAIRRHARLTLPLIPMSLDRMQKGAARSHFPDGMHWSVDNMWTDAPVEALLPGLRRIAETMPPAPSHVLWLDWRPQGGRPDMAFSVEGQRYIALYGEWKRAEDDARFDGWAAGQMRAMAPLACGIQLADENLGQRPARFLTDANAARLAAARGLYDPEERFVRWMADPVTGGGEGERAARAQPSIHTVTAALTAAASSATTM